MTNQSNFSKQAADEMAAAVTAAAVEAQPDTQTEASGPIPFLTETQKQACRHTARLCAGCLLPFCFAWLLSRAPLLYDTQPLGIAFLCAVGRGKGNGRGSSAADHFRFFLSAALGIGAACIFGVYGDRSVLYTGAFLLAVGIRYAVGRFLSDGHSRGPAHPGFGAAKGRGKSYLSEDTDGDTPRTARTAPTAPLSRLIQTVLPAQCFSADLGMRIGISVLTACPIAAGTLLTANNTVRGMLGAGFLLCVIPAFTWLFSGITEGEVCTPGHREAGIAALCFSLTAACGSAMILGFSLKLLAAHGITLFIAKKCGYLRGSICGLVCGFACDALYAPSYALIGAAAGVLKDLWLAPAVIISLCTGAAYAIYVGEFAALRAVVPEMITASAIAYPIMRYAPELCRKNKFLRAALARLDTFAAPYLHPTTADAVSKSSISPDDPSSDLPRTRITPEELGIPGLAQQLDTLSGILNGLSTTFYHLSDRQKKPGLFEVRTLCEGVAEGYCTGCANHAACWEENFSKTADAMGRITLSMYRRGHVGNGGKGACGADAFVPLDKTCPHLAAMLAEMNDAAATLYEEKLKNDKTEVTAGDYEGMAKLLRASAEDAARAGERDDALSRRLARVIQKMGFSAQDISVYGSRRQTVIAHGVSMGSGASPTELQLLGTEELREAFSAVVGVRYRPPVYSFGRGEGDGVTMTLHAEPKFGMSGGCWGEKKAGEEITGDVLTLFSNRADYYYTLLCDGMGSGREASVTAQIASLFLEKMLSVSCAKGAALNLLNGYLRARNGECSATVDLCEIDMITGEAHFVKCGAAASYLLRGDSMFRIASQTMPLGILREVSSEETAFTLCDGDVLLFFSDGVCGECEDAAWIPATLDAAKEAYAKVEVREKARIRTAAAAQEGSSDTAESYEKLPARCDALARALGEEAKKRIGRADDMTVIYLEVRSL